MKHHSNCIFLSLEIDSIIVICVPMRLLGKECSSRKSQVQSLVLTLLLWKINTHTDTHTHAHTHTHTHTHKTKCKSARAVCWTVINGVQRINRKRVSLISRSFWQWLFWILWFKLKYNQTTWFSHAFG